MKLLTVLRKTKRSISPVISVILLIGLAVAATALLFVFVLPMIAPTSNLIITDADVRYDNAFTVLQSKDKGYGEVTLTIRNDGTAQVEIVDLNVFYYDDSAEEWLSPPFEDNQGVSNQNPVTVKSAAQVPQGETLTAQFELPTLNDDASVRYKAVVTDENDNKFDTSLSENVDEISTMVLEADRPTVQHNVLPTYIRSNTAGEKFPFSPIITDNQGTNKIDEGIKNVTYQITGPDSLSYTLSSDDAPFSWSWNTRNNSQYGVNNGTYTLDITVFDYAGLSKSLLAPLTFIIDNDYVDPTIHTVIGNALAEVGQDYSISATITDSGTAESGKSEVFTAKAHYRINGTTEDYEPAVLTDPNNDNIWTGLIPLSFIDMNAFANNITYYVEATDKAANEENKTDIPVLEVNDTIKPDFTTHFFEGEEVLVTTLTGDEGQTISISTTVLDNNFDGDINYGRTESVNLVWREKNDTTLDIPDPWEVSTNVSGTDNSWEFRIPSINVTLDGLEYYLNATDHNGNGPAYVIDQATTYNVQIPDNINPTIAVLGSIPSKVTESDPVSVVTAISDNDRSFSWIGSETGTVQIGYKQTVMPDFIYLNLNHTSGDSSQGETAVWEGIIPGSIFNKTESPTVTIRIRAIDQSGKSSQEDYTIEIVAGGVPVLKYEENSVQVSGGPPTDNILRFDINNSAGGLTAATATINAIDITLINNTKTDYLSGVPYIIQMNASAGTNPVWENSTLFEGANATKINLDNPFTLPKGSSTAIWLVYANSTGNYYDINDFTVSVVVYYSYASGTGYDILQDFNTPVTTFQPISEPRYMRSNQIAVGVYELGTSRSGVSLEENSNRIWGSQTVTFGFRVYIDRNTDGSLDEEITSGLVIISSNEGPDNNWYHRQKDWVCPETSLNTDDAIVIQIIANVGSSGNEVLATFRTEALNANKLTNSQWTIHTYIRVRYQGLRTRAYFGFGDSTWDSRIENFGYEKVPG
ncbi:MAG: archaellin/type IV pilin N-terminal domain-containing protein [Candidatus Hodarchaeales archaeon]